MALYTPGPCSSAHDAGLSCCYQPIIHGSASVRLEPCVSEIGHRMLMICMGIIVASRLLRCTIRYASCYE